MLVVVGVDDGAVGKHHLEIDDGVTHPPHAGPQVRNAPTDRQTADPHAGCATPTRCQPSGVELRVYLASGCASANRHKIPTANRDGFEAAEVDGDTAVDVGRTCEAGVST